MLEVNRDIRNNLLQFKGLDMTIREVIRFYMDHIITNFTINSIPSNIFN